MFESRTGLLILFLSVATFIWGIPKNKYELWGYIKWNKNVRKTPASRTMNLELCKFPRMHLTHFRLVQRQSATVTAHTCALSWHSPFKLGFNWHQPTNRQLTNFVGLSVPTNSLTNFDLTKREFNWHESTLTVKGPVKEKRKYTHVVAGTIIISSLHSIMFMPFT